LKASYTKIRELPTAWFEFLADQRPLSDVFCRLENGRFRHGLLGPMCTNVGSVSVFT
jgi:HAMP domain-containing protein